MSPVMLLIVFAAVKLVLIVGLVMISVNAITRLEQLKRQRVTAEAARLPAADAAEPATPPEPVRRAA